MYTPYQMQEGRDDSQIEEDLNRRSWGNDQHFIEGDDDDEGEDLLNDDGREFTKWLSASYS